jgi:hypothetical protein
MDRNQRLDFIHFARECQDDGTVGTPSRQRTDLTHVTHGPFDRPTARTRISTPSDRFKTLVPCPSRSPGIPPGGGWGRPAEGRAGAGRAPAAPSGPPAGPSEGSGPEPMEPMAGRTPLPADPIRPVASPGWPLAPAAAAAPAPAPAAACCWFMAAVSSSSSVTSKSSSSSGGGCGREHGSGSHAGWAAGRLERCSEV